MVDDADGRGVGGWVERAPLVVVTPWYPNDTDPFAGAFVRASVLGLRAAGREVMVVHVENVAPDDRRPPTRYTVDDVEVAWIGVPTDPLLPRDRMARNQRAALEAHLPPELGAAEQVHVHVGMPTGWAVVGVVPPTARLVLTEHATYLGKIFRSEASRELYALTMARVDALTAVSEFLARSIRTAVPQQAHKVLSLPNVMSLDSVPFTEHPAGPLRRWLYVGRLVPAKGVERLLRAFALACGRPGSERLRLTMVGQGPMRAELLAMADALGVADRVELPGAVPPDEVRTWMARADVLVHLAHLETFGLTMVEAVAAGLPVVATLSGGPQESLATAEVLDRARTVAVGDDPEPVLRAIDELEAALPGSDAATARADVQARYDGSVVVPRLDALLRGVAGPDDGYAASWPRVLGISVHPTAQRTLMASVGAVVEQGGRAVVVTNRPGDFVVHGPAVQVVDLSPIERRFLLYAVERVVLERVPLTALRTVRRVTAHAAGRTSGSAAARLDRAAELTAYLTTRWARFARHRRPRLYARAYEQVAPWWLARVADRTVLAAPPVGEVRPEELDLLLTPDWRAQPFAWRLVRRAPVPSRRRVNRLQVARMRLEAGLPPHAP